MESLRDYQVADLCFYMANERCANLSDPGTGKTPSVCVYIWWLWTEKQTRTVFVMPKSLLKKNKAELLRFTDLSPDEVVILDGPPTARAALLAKDWKVILCGFDRFAADWQKLTAAGAVVVDEIHMGFSSVQAKRTQQLMQAMQHFRYFLAMTGTLINGRLNSAYPTIAIIEPRYYVSEAAFLNYHAIRDAYDRVVAWRNHDTLARIIGQHAIRRSFESVYGTESKVIIHEPVEMSGRQAEAYREFEELAMIELEEDFLSSNGVGGVHALRCRQILAHPENLSLSDGRRFSLTDERTAKDENLLVHLADWKNAGSPFIIFSSLVPEQERLLKLVQGEGLEVGFINGSVSAPRRAKIDEDFRAGRLQGIVASPATAAVGFNWERADDVYFASLDYMDSSFVQGYRRAIRGPRSKPLRIWVPEYQDTIERKIFQIIERKSQDAHLVDPTREKLHLSSGTTVK